MSSADALRLGECNDKRLGSRNKLDEKETDEDKAKIRSIVKLDLVPALDRYDSVIYLYQIPPTFVLTTSNTNFKFFSKTWLDHTYAHGYAKILMKKLPSLVTHSEILNYSAVMYKEEMSRAMQKLFRIGEAKLTKVICDTLERNNINRGKRHGECAPVNWEEAKQCIRSEESRANFNANPIGTLDMINICFRLPMSDDGWARDAVSEWCGEHFVSTSNIMSNSDQSCRKHCLLRVVKLCTTGFLEAVKNAEENTFGCSLLKQKAEKRNNEQYFYIPIDLPSQPSSHVQSCTLRILKSKVNIYSRFIKSQLMHVCHIAKAANISIVDLRQNLEVASNAVENNGKADHSVEADEEVDQETQKRLVAIIKDQVLKYDYLRRFATIRVQHTQQNYPTPQYHLSAKTNDFSQGQQHCEDGYTSHQNASQRRCSGQLESDQDRAQATSSGPTQSCCYETYHNQNLSEHRISSSLQLASQKSDNVDIEASYNQIQTYDQRIEIQQNYIPGLPSQTVDLETATQLIQMQSSIGVHATTNEAISAGFEERSNQECAIHFANSAFRHDGIIQDSLTVPTVGRKATSTCSNDEQSNRALEEEIVADSVVQELAANEDEMSLSSSFANGKTSFDYEEGNPDSPVKELVTDDGTKGGQENQQSQCTKHIVCSRSMDRASGIQISPLADGENESNDSMQSTTRNKGNVHSLSPSPKTKTLVCCSGPKCNFVQSGTSISTNADGTPRVKCINCEGPLHSVMCGMLCNVCPEQFFGYLTPNGRDRYRCDDSLLCIPCVDKINVVMKRSKTADNQSQKPSQDMPVISQLMSANGRESLQNSAESNVSSCQQQSTQCSNVASKKSNKRKKNINKTMGERKKKNEAKLSTLSCQGDGVRLDPKADIMKLQNDKAKEGHKVKICPGEIGNPIHLHRDKVALYSCCNALLLQDPNSDDLCLAILCSNCFEKYEKDVASSSSTSVRSSRRSCAPSTETLERKVKKCVLDKRKFELVTETNWWSKSYRGKYDYIPNNCMDCKGEIFE